jgi:hypothetical protein
MNQVRNHQEQTASSATMKLPTHLLCYATPSVIVYEAHRLLDGDEEQLTDVAQVILYLE